MRISQRGLALVKSFEGCLKPIGNGKFKPYICPAGVLTIGWGHTNHHGRQFTPDAIWTQDECDSALSDDLRGFEAAVERLVRVPLNQSQFDALVSFTYNCGEGNLSKSSLLRRLNGSDYDGAAEEFARWNRGGGKVLAGLTRRREAEAALFRSEPVQSTPDGPMPQQVDPPPDDGSSIPPIIYPRPMPTPTPAKDPWYKRAWKWTASTLFGGGIMIGGFQLNANTLLAATLFLVVAGIAAAVFFIGKKKGWWG